jgi:hypothetical protein
MKRLSCRKDTKLQHIITSFESDMLNNYGKYRWNNMKVKKNTCPWMIETNGSEMNVQLVDWQINRENGDIHNNYDSNGSSLSNEEHFKRLYKR